MAKKLNVNLDNLLAVMLLDLRNHLKKCRLCSVALEARTFDMLCDYTKQRILDIGRKWDRNIPDRLAAKRSESRSVYPCPNPARHGQAYALTAEIVYVHSSQSPLF